MEKPSSSSSSPKKTESRLVHFFHRIAVLMVLAGGGGSIAFTVYAGRSNNSVVLIVLFIGWVLSPFITLLLVNTLANRRSVTERVCLYSIMIIITLASLLAYSGQWTPPDAKPAAVFLITPFLSWVFMSVGYLIVSTLPNRN
jgi:hypothetical protein